MTTPLLVPSAPHLLVYQLRQDFTADKFENGSVVHKNGAVVSLFRLTNHGKDLLTIGGENCQQHSLRVFAKPKLHAIGKI
jgi:hypothetical protein